MRRHQTTTNRSVGADREVLSPLGDGAVAVAEAARRARLIAVSAAPGLWRVSGREGIVIGHLRSTGQGATLRFRALRYQPLSRAFVELGDFWSCDQALDCLRLSR